MSETRLPSRSRRCAAPAAALAAALLAAGCDSEAADVEIFAVALQPEYDDSLLRPGRVAAEPHNAPLPGMIPSEVAGLIRLPEGLPQALDLPPVAPGGWARSEHGRLLRLAIIFNPQTPPKGDALCAAEAPLPADPPQADRYEATLALCLRGQALAEGRIRARRSGDLDAAWVSSTLTELLDAVLRPGGAQG
ncbi:hypothetical protein [uncultured Albimonas sp.]|uniref:hypothetical protein n=1 Tax=uncultured Albimonas sp. TaxID=1331701 RepID=UPI0030EDE529|tara:strand:+ start:1750 stop:2325 length:576 start_codon:yes stop_codon:yes gene_type:complete